MASRRCRRSRRDPRHPALDAAFTLVANRHSETSRSDCNLGERDTPSFGKRADVVDTLVSSNLSEFLIRFND
jgi:hypothetical protein